jgi:arylsulfatase A-like enzyme
MEQLRTHILGYSALIFLSVLLFCPACGTEVGHSEETQAETETIAGAKKRLPNIVLFSIDTLRADHLGSYGYPKKTSERIDDFARESVLFEHAISQAPSTAPSHMSLFTGLMPSVHKIEPLPTVTSLAKNIKTFPELLQQMGYLTAGFHGGLNVAATMGFDRGFHLYTDNFVSPLWFKAHRNPDDLAAIRLWIEIAKHREAPFFLFLHHYNCHSPYISAPEEYRDRFLKGKEVKGLISTFSDKQRLQMLDEAQNAESDFGKARYVPAVRDKTMRKASKDALGPAFLERVDLSRNDHMEHVIALYDAGVSYSDYLFHEVQKILKSQGVYDDTIVVLFSDHGEEFFEHKEMLHGRLFREQLHVPLIMRFPAQSQIPSGRINTPVRIVDIMPTIFDYIGKSINHPVQGLSFMPLVTKTGRYNPKIVSYTGESIRIEKDEYVYSNAEYGETKEWLFNSIADPREQNNIAQDAPNDVGCLVRAVKQQEDADETFRGKIERYQDISAQNLSENLVKKLKEMGYVDTPDGE